MRNLRHDRALPALAILFVVLLRAFHPVQLIVENYVGRQVPTAMVARNLERGSGFLRPQLDTAPIPNLFLVEPPIYAQLASLLRSVTGLGLTVCGRWASALATGLAAWGLFGLAVRREGPQVALLAVVAFGLFPVTIRYGRAFQPDALMLGLLVAGMRLWDDFEAEGGTGRLAAAWLLVATGLAVKVVAASVLVPLVLVIVRPPRTRKIIALSLSIAPALIWYVYAARLLDEGSRASADNATLWFRALGFSSLFRLATWTLSARFLLLRSFTPLGFALAIWGLFAVSGGDRLWRLWLASTGAAFLVMAGKIHHEYYWMMLAPMMAVGVARGTLQGKTGGGLTLSSYKRGQGEGAARPFDPRPPHDFNQDGPDPRPRETGSRIVPPPLPKLLPRGGRGLVPAIATRGALFVAFGTLGIVQSAPTWRTPPDWDALPRAVAAVDRLSPSDAKPLLIAPEALLFAADRRGFRLETDPAARVRAAGEFGAVLDPAEPLALIAFYRTKGAKYFVDLLPVGDEPERRLLHDAIRRRYNVRVDHGGVIFADLVDSSAR